jgi:hypothetical protein
MNLFQKSVNCNIVDMYTVVTARPGDEDGQTDK